MDIAGQEGVGLTAVADIVIAETAIATGALAIWVFDPSSSAVFASKRSEFDFLALGYEFGIEADLTSDIDGDTGRS